MNPDVAVVHGAQRAGKNGKGQTVLMLIIMAYR
jgi:hypothetical protein